MKTTKLRTSWTWAVYKKDGEKVFDVVYGAKKDGRAYRVAKCVVEKGTWRADMAGMFGYIWEAMTGEHYTTPQEAAKAIVAMHKAWLAEKEARQAELDAYRRLY